MKADYDPHYVTSCGSEISNSFRKKMLDFFVALTLLLSLSPLVIFLSILLFVFYGESPIFVQKRVGLNGAVFRIFKLRTMRSSGNANVITPIGKVLRKYRLDELPQLVNVLLGDMSLIGPRPESLELAYLYESEVRFFGLRHCVRPGITGWAQINQGHVIGVDQTERKLELDLYYITNWTFLLDIYIAYKTLGVVFAGKERVV
ncbi:sugar transferase [Balneatrix alpica]|uniref:Sugar transferase n=1 Tax=Balneatrix alpica TaxID=75684 RepID=A0ABV5ZE81_9GAMM|nr:sugar transferase [Balneatrix alpica]